MSNLQLIYDYETLNNRPWLAPMVNLSTLIFDWDRFLSDNPYTFEELLEEVNMFKFDITSQVEHHGRVISKDTLNWWQTLPESTRQQLKPSHDDLHPSEVITIFKKMAAIIDNPFAKHWCRGNNFDHVITDMWFDDYQLEFNDVFKFGMLRDVRTFIDTESGGLVKSSYMPDGIEGFEAHNSMHDIAMDVMRMQTLYRETRL